MSTNNNPQTIQYYMALVDNLYDVIGNLKDELRKAYVEIERLKGYDDDCVSPYQYITGT